MYMYMKIGLKLFLLYWEKQVLKIGRVKYDNVINRNIISTSILPDSWNEITQTAYILQIIFIGIN